jgi:hypothetical protein
MYGVILVWLGFRIWVLIDDISYLEEQIETQGQLIVSMAKELSELGSPNITLVPNESYQIKYANKE